MGLALANEAGLRRFTLAYSDEFRNEAVVLSAHVSRPVW